MNTDRTNDRHTIHDGDGSQSTHTPMEVGGGWVPLALTPITVSPEAALGRYIAPLWLETRRWTPAPDNDPEIRALFHRHAAENGTAHGSASRRGRTLTGSGDRLILATHQADALIVFRRFSNPDREFGHGVHCAVFRNEGHFRSCSLIREAVEEWAWKRWPGERFYTYVGGRRIVATNPGYAFRCAGWKRCGVTFGELIVMERVPPP